MKISNRLISSTLLLASLSISCFAWAKEQKIGFIDREQIMTKTLYAKDMQEIGKKQFKTKIDNLEQNKKKFLTDKETLERDRDILAEGDVNKRMNKLQTDFEKVQKQEEELGEEIEAFNVKYQKKVINDAVGQLAKENELEILLPADVALYGSKKFDYTFRAIELMDKSFKESKS